MKDEFNKHIEELESHKWVGVTDLSEQFDISKRTVFSWLKDGKIQGIKWKNRRLISVGSVFKFLMEKKILGISKIKNKEMVREIELNQFKEL